MIEYPVATIKDHTFKFNPGDRVLLDLPDSPLMIVIDTVNSPRGEYVRYIVEVVYITELKEIAHCELDEDLLKKA